MRSALYSKDDFLKRAALKKPRLQALVDQAPEMSKESIETLSEPLWVREGLEILRQSGGVSQTERVAAMVARAEERGAPSGPAATYEVRIWEGASAFIGNDDAEREWSIEANHGDPILLITSPRDHAVGQVYVGSSVTNLGPRSHDVMLASSKMVSYMTLDQFKGLNQAILNSRHGV